MLPLIRLPISVELVYEVADHSFLLLAEFSRSIIPECVQRFLHSVTKAVTNDFLSVFSKLWWRNDSPDDSCIGGKLIDGTVYRISGLKLLQ